MLQQSDQNDHERLNDIQGTPSEYPVHRLSGPDS